MKFFITFKVQNPDFSSKYAKEYNFGKESDGNWKDLWSKGFKLNANVLEYNETKDSSFILRLEGKNNLPKIFQIADVTKVKCITDKNEEIEIVVSNKLISKTHVAHNQRYDTTRFYFYLKHDIEYRQLSDFIYLAYVDIPAQLLNEND